MPDLDPTSPDFYDLVVVGRGYSASTYLFTADLSWCNKILIIAGPDAWEHIVRGDGIVNHANYIYARDNPDAQINPQPIPAPRSELRDENAAIYAKSVSWLKKQKITVDEVPGVTKEIDKQTCILGSPITRPEHGTAVFQINQGDAVSVYSIEYDVWNKLPNDDWTDVQLTQNKTAKALKVVYCGGAGPHRDDYGKDKNFDLKTFLDLDGFMRDQSILPNDNSNKLIVIGPNAGLDAAVEALKRGFDLYWLIAGVEGTDPAWLSTKHYSITNTPDGSIIPTANACVVNYDYRKASLSRNQTGNGYEMSFEEAVFRRKNPHHRTHTINADYVVYATGQTPYGEEVFGQNKNPWRIGPAKVLKPILAKEQLTPIYDINQRFGQWYETALGLKDERQSKYSGLEVLGAAALSLANDRINTNTKQAYLENAYSTSPRFRLALQNGMPLNTALQELQKDAWANNTMSQSLAAYLSQQRDIPTVGQSMASILPKLYQQTLVAADQLGVIKSQIESVTGFGIIAASTDSEMWITHASNLRRSTQELKRQIKILVTDYQSADLSPLKAAISDYEETNLQFDSVNQYANDAAKQYVTLLSYKDKLSLQAEGFSPNGLAHRVNQSIYRLASAVYILCLSDHNCRNIRCLIEVSTEISTVQKWLTNLEVVFQTLTTANIQTGIALNRSDETQLAALMAARYPSIPATQWPGIAAKIISGREIYPWGYDPSQQDEINNWLSGLNKGNISPFPIKVLTPKL